MSRRAIGEAGRTAAVALACALALAGAARADLPAVKEVTLRRDNGKGEPGEVVKFFTVDDHRLHFHVELEALKFGQTVAKWSFVGLDTEAGKDLPIAEYTTSGLVVNEIDGSVKLPRDWPAGKYRASLSLNGELVAPIDYEVRRPTTNIQVKAVRLKRDNGKREAGAVVPAFHPGDRLQFMEVETGGMGPAAQVKWVFRAVETSGGRNVLIGTVDTAASDAQSSVLVSHIELPRDWPVGTYDAEVIVNGATLTHVAYRVVPDGAAVASPSPGR